MNHEMANAYPMEVVYGTSTTSRGQITDPATIHTIHIRKNTHFKVYHFAYITQYRKSNLSRIKPMGGCWYV